MSDTHEVNRTSILDEFAAVANAVEGDVEPHEIFTQLQAPDLSKGIPDKFWEQLHIPEGRRSGIDGSGYLASEHHQLLVRLRLLHEHTLRNFGANSRVAAQSFVDAVYTSLPTELAETAITGGMIGIEAYQIASGHDLTSAFTSLTAENVDAAFAKLPDRLWWGKGLSQRIVGDWKEPEAPHMGIYTDARQIARYAIQNDLAMAHGAVVMSDLIATNWPKLFNHDLPEYHTPQYANKDLNLPGLI